MNQAANRTDGAAAHPRNRRGARVRRAGLAIAAVGALLFGSTACSFSTEWASMSPGVTSEHQAAQHRGQHLTGSGTDGVEAAGATEKVGAAASMPTGALGTGSVTHRLAAGAMGLDVVYWTDPDAAGGHGQPRQVDFSIHVKRRDAPTRVKVTQVKVIAPGNAVLLDDIGEFALQPPYGYTSAFLAPASTGANGPMELSVQVDLLVETTAGSGQFYRQTNIDHLTLAFPPAAQNPQNPQTSQDKS